MTDIEKRAQAVTAWLADIGSGLEDRETGESIAERLIATYDLQPFILSNGRLGIHFMNLSWSSDYGETLIEQIREEIAAGREDLQEWRDTLAAALGVVDAALGQRKS